MVDDRIEIFSSCGIAGLQIQMNRWFETNPDYYIRNVKIYKEIDNLWYAHVWYQLVHLEEEQEL